MKRQKTAIQGKLCVYNSYKFKRLLDACDKANIAITIKSVNSDKTVRIKLITQEEKIRIYSFLSTHIVLEKYLSAIITKILIDFYKDHSENGLIDKTLYRYTGKGKPEKSVTNLLLKTK